MSSTIKALDLLSFFSTSTPEIGLSQMCRLARRDKATTYRHLSALEVCGFIEQNPVTKGYRLGPALLQLGRMRERTVPRETGAELAVRALADLTGETVHVSVLSGGTLFALMAQESTKHSTRAIIDISTFPLHATASGICTLAFGPTDLFEQACETLERFTPSTPITSDALAGFVETARTRAIARSDGKFEADIHSLSAPVFEQDGKCAGAVSVACVATRFTPDLERTITLGLIDASRDITCNWGGRVPPEVEAAWAKTSAAQQELEPTS